MGHTKAYHNKDKLLTDILAADDTDILVVDDTTSTVRLYSFYHHRFFCSLYAKHRLRIRLMLCDNAEHIIASIFHRRLWSR